MTLPTAGYFTDPNQTNGGAKQGQDDMLEVLRDLYESGNLTVFAALTLAADKLMYASGASELSLTDLTAFARTLLATDNAAAARTALGLVIGTHVQAHDADTAKTDVRQAWTKPQRPTPSTVNIASAFDASAYAAIKHTLAANTTVAAPSNTPVEGDELYLHITGASTYTLSWNIVYKASASTALPSAPAAGKVLSVCFRYNGTNWQLIGRRVDA